LFVGAVELSWSGGLSCRILVGCVQVLKAALQRDPENKAVIRKLKGSRRVAQDSKQCQDGLQAALKAREFMRAVDVATDGLQASRN
jgi:hypothetical protein